MNCDSFTMLGNEPIDFLSRKKLYAKILLELCSPHKSELIFFSLGGDCVFEHTEISRGTISGCWHLKVNSFIRDSPPKQKQKQRAAWSLNRTPGKGYLGNKRREREWES